LCHQGKSAKRATSDKTIIMCGTPSGRHDLEPTGRNVGDFGTWPDANTTSMASAASIMVCISNPAPRNAEAARPTPLHDVTTDAKSGASVNGRFGIGGV
jgi:hypothetical protein